MERKRILAIDDDDQMLELLKKIFSRTSCEFYAASSGIDGLRQLYAHCPDLVLLDVMMPEMDGWQVCARIRQYSNVPIIFLSALGQNQYISRGLDGGADDYVTKPISVEVLLARVRAALRRAVLPHGNEGTVAYSDGYLTLDLDQRRVFADSKPVKLSRTEYKLLVYLFQNAGRPLSAKEILKHVWGYHNSMHYVHTYMYHLRKKMEKDPRRPRYLVTEPGTGYRFRKYPPAELN